MKPVIIVGAGFFGSVVAERIAEDLKLPVTVIDRRNHIGGNCWSEIDPETGVEYHKYGSHIFHTSDVTVWEYVNRFDTFNEYRHSVWTTYQGEVYTLPMNLSTINQFYHTALSPQEAEKFICAEAAKEHITNPQNLEEKAVSLIGRKLYEAFFRGYTIKQWEKSPTELAADIITRLPIRYNYNHRYFSDKFEGIPLAGYGTMLKKILSNPLISVKTNCDWREFKKELGTNAIVIYTGAIDEFFDYALGTLEWRTVDFEIERFHYSDYQGTTVMNYADEKVPFTRIHEFKHYHPERPDTGKTIIFKEYSRFAGRGDEPYYPVLTEKNKKLYSNYKIMAEQQYPNLFFGGRLGLYKYLDMDDTVFMALEFYQKLKQDIVNGRF